MSFVKSILHNIFVLLVGFGFAYVGKALDFLFGVAPFQSTLAIGVGIVFVVIGFLIRLWAAYLFYQHQMDVIVLRAQSALVTTGPFAFSRNPLYLGGNVFIFFGTSLILGTPGGLMLTFLQLFGVDFMIRREEKQLEERFGEEFRAYKKRVRRWI